MTPSLNENMVEDAVQRQLEELGWEVLDVYSEQFGENGTLGRELKSEVVLKRCLREALVKFNPDLPAIKNLRPTEGFASAMVTENPASAKTSAAINPEGPAPMIKADFTWGTHL